MSGTRTVSPRRLRQIGACCICAVALLSLGAAEAPAARAPAPPKAGAWKLILAQNTPKGPIITKQVIGGFRVTRQRTITGFHLTFTEEGETTSCAGGEENARKKASIGISSAQRIPIVKAGSSWVVAASTGTLGGGQLQPAEVVVTLPNGGASRNSQLSMTLVTRKGPRIGAVTWNQDTCSVAFVVQPG